MTRTENPKVVESVVVLRCVRKSSCEISNVLKERNMKLSPSGARRLIARNSGKSKGNAKRMKRTMNPGSPKVRTKTLVKKVKEDLKKSNPLTRRQARSVPAYCVEDCARRPPRNSAKEMQSSRPFSCSSRPTIGTRYAVPTIPRRWEIQKTSQRGWVLAAPNNLQWNSPYLLSVQRRRNGGKLEEILASVASKGRHVFHGR